MDLMSAAMPAVPERKAVAVTGTPNLIFWMLVFSFRPAAPLRGA
jgi:hypothetical protein